MMIALSCLLLNFHWQTFHAYLHVKFKALYVHEKKVNCSLCSKWYNALEANVYHSLVSGFIIS